MTVAAVGRNQRQTGCQKTGRRTRAVSRALPRQSVGAERAATEEQRSKLEQTFVYANQAPILFCVPSKVAVLTRVDQRHRLRRFARLSGHRGQILCTIHLRK